MSNTLADKVKIIFARYTAAKEFHFTADAQAFSLESDARNHARTLEDKTVRKITRDMVKSGDIYGTPEKPKDEGKDTGKGAKNEFQSLDSAREPETKEPASKKPEEDKAPAKEPVKDPSTGSPADAAPEPVEGVKEADSKKEEAKDGNQNAKK